MRIDIGQTTNLFHVNALNKNMDGNAKEKKETQGIDILPRKDVAMISPMGKASNALQNLVNQLETGQEVGKYQNSQMDSGHANDEDSQGTVKYQVSEEGQDYFQYQVENGTQAAFSDKNLDMKKVQQDSIYYKILESSDIGFNQPTIETQLRCANNDYLNEAIEKGKDPEESVYDHIVNIHRDSLMKAYQDVYNDIVTGYANGTREVWTQNFEEGADYIEFELDGNNYRFHKLTMEEELARLDRAYEKAAKKAADITNLMIDTQKAVEKVMPEFQRKMRETGAELAGRLGLEIGENAEIMAERIKDKILMPEERTERINWLFEMFMEERENFLNAEIIK